MLLLLPREIFTMRDNATSPLVGEVGFPRFALRKSVLEIRERGAPPRFAKLAFGSQSETALSHKGRGGALFVVGFDTDPLFARIWMKRRACPDLQAPSRTVTKP